ncbi:Unknown protein sequence [Pseudomonas syringae pv. syringae]|nr:Unknown protein sequence [Pseudomonas syringae pv. syringae]
MILALTASIQASALLALISTPPHEKPEKTKKQSDHSAF